MYKCVNAILTDARIHFDSVVLRLAMVSVNVSVATTRLVHVKK